MSRAEILLEAGQNSLDRGDFIAAVAEFSELTQHAPRAPIAWCGRSAAFFGANEFAKALAAAKRAQELAPADPRVFYVLAPAAYATGDAAAIDQCGKFVRRLELHAGGSMASFWSARLSEKDYFPQAADAFGVFAAKHPNHIDTAFHYVDLLLNAFRLDEALAALQRIAAAGAPKAGVDALSARAHLTRGDIENAGKAAKSAIAADRNCIAAYAVLSETDPSAIEPSQEAHLQSIVSTEATPADKRIVGEMALGRFREKRGDIEGAFAAFSRSNEIARLSLVRSGISYNRAAQEAQARAEIARYPEAPPVREEARDPRLIFIIGMPRSGSTLIDQILSRHSAVSSVGESIIVPRFASAISNKASKGAPYSSLIADHQSAFGDAYRSASDDAAVVVDKNLFNFQHCGLISALSPGARFVLVLRDPADVALSIFKIKFMAALPWTNDLADIAHMTAVFELLTDHWRRIFADRILTVRHEDLVANFEPGVRTILDFCNLGFEPECLSFHEGERAVFTTSAAQVRRPVNTEGVGRWRRYEPFLGPFFKELEQCRAALARSA